MKINLMLKLCNILLTKNNIYFFYSQMQILDVIHSVQWSLIKSAVLVSHYLVGFASEVCC